jgi:RNA methyltransferase, TrmH family
MTVIQSRDNPRFKQIKRLAESGRERKKQGKTLLDGVHLIQAYEQQFGPVEALFVTESAMHSPEISAYTAGRDWFLLADTLMRDIGLVDTPSGLLAVISQPPSVTVDHSADAILLDGIQDPGNVGTLLRTAAAAGCRQALLSTTCAAAWSPKVLRAGQGAHFAINVVEDADLANFVAHFRGTTAATSLDQAVSLYEAKWDSPLAWIFGSEGAGVSPALMAAASLRVRIPMPGSVESLNVSAAAAVCLFEALRRRLA